MSILDEYKKQNPLADNVELEANDEIIEQTPEYWMKRVKESMNPQYQQVDYSREQDIINAFSQAGQRPAPTYDQGREKRLETIAGAKGIANALNVLGDAFAVHKNAPIRPTQLDNLDPYIQQIMQDKKDYKDKMNQYEQQQFLDRLNKHFKIGEGRAADASEAQRRIEKAQDADRQIASDAVKAAEGARRFDVTEGRLDQARKDLKKYREDSLALQRDKMLWDKVFKMSTSGGKLYDLSTPDGKPAFRINDSGQVQAIFSAIIHDQAPGLQAEAMDRLKFFKSQMDGLSPANMKAFISEFWHRSPDAIKALQGMTGQAQPQENTPPAGVPAWLGGQPNQTTPTEYIPGTNLPKPPTEQATPPAPAATPAAETKQETPAQETTSTGPRAATDEEGAAIREALKNKDTKALKSVLLGMGWPEDQVNEYIADLESVPVEKVKEREAAEKVDETNTSEITNKYPEEVREIFGGWNVPKNAAYKIATRMGQAQGLTGQKLADFRNENMPQIIEDVKQYREAIKSGKRIEAEKSKDQRAAETQKKWGNYGK